MKIKVSRKNGHLSGGRTYHIVFISLSDGVLGFVLGVVLTYLAAVIVQGLGYEWEFILTFQSAFVALGVVLAIGIFFGLYPARKAAEVSPMEALRYE